MYDVVVVGAGPAGGMTAWRLADKGYRVSIADKKPVVGLPVKCGEGMSKFSLESNGVPTEGPYIVKKVKGVKIVSPGGYYYYMKEPGFCVDRTILDQWLVERAVEKGAELHMSTYVSNMEREQGTWNITTKNLNSGKTETIRCKIVASADGAWSNIGNASGLGRNSQLYKGLQYKFDIDKCPEILRDPEWMRFYFGQEFPNGYGWAFDRDREMSIGVCGEGNMAVLLKNLCKKLGVKPQNKKETNAGMIPVGGVNKQLAGDGIITIGDAAGLTNPISDGGNHAALYSGNKAGEALHRALQGERDALESYQKKLHASPFNHPWLYKGAKAIHSFSDQDWDFFAGMAHERTMGELSKKEVLSAFLRSPKHLLSLRKAIALKRASKIYRHYGW